MSLRFYGKLKIPLVRKRYFVDKIYRPFPRQVSPALLLDVSAGNCQRALVDESGMITHQNQTQEWSRCKDRRVRPSHKDKGYIRK
jgi:hypothetical protein